MKGLTIRLMVGLAFALPLMLLATISRIVKPYTTNGGSGFCAAADALGDRHGASQTAAGTVAASHSR
jgi:hypothetical protein